MKRVLVVVAGALMLAACGSPTSSEPGALVSSSSNSSAPTAEESSAAATPESSPTASPPAPAPKPVTYSGKGTKVLKIKKPEDGPVLITTVLSGPDDNGTVYSLDADLEENDLLVNTIGDYRGTSVLDLEDSDSTTRLKIDYSGKWVITLRPLNSAPEITKSYAGKKDAVLVSRSDSPKILTFVSKSGDSNVTVYWYNADGEDLLVNDIGKFKGESPVGAGPGFFVVSSDGAWTMTLADA
ncbi:MAG: hypothetical protein U0S36_12515 [Candidatus Nanopelagicales bacterium]